MCLSILTSISFTPLSSNALCEFLAHNHCFTIEKKRGNKMEATRAVQPDDISTLVRGRNGQGVSIERGGVAVLVQHFATMQTILRTKLMPGDNVLQTLRAEVDRGLYEIV
ncbi:hypothetical protein BDW02DRAFT_324703 [Decorospora gaudefroyi]|uniref:Uncharacterized protein n=1 Tax=Decorospora gaudefroyi TaxID=184978 RepID=A0A6A5KFK8_9PLEO|nr:hypothetical protein BDW02DRAFT_324703 [Decorospora gaudefroyi]